MASRTVFLSAILSVAAAFAADIEYSVINDGKTLCVSVPEGTTNTFDYANYAAALTGNAYTNLVKLGRGGLDMKDSVAGFAGDIYVNEGSLRYWSQYSLGSIDASCKVIVADGATLAVCGDSTHPKFTLDGKTFILEGFGVDGIGAMYCDNMVQADKYPAALRICLKGDTRFGGRNRLDLASRTVIDMGGNDLYVSTDSRNSALAFLGGISVENPGSIIIEKTGALMMYGGVNWAAADGCAVYVKDDAYLQASDCSRPVMTWPVYCTSANGLLVSGNQNWTDSGLMTNRYIYAGTFHADNGPVKISSVSARTGLGLTFQGKVTGDGGLWLAGGNPAETANGIDLHLNLLNPENDFKSGVEVSYGTLHLYAPGALPAAGGDLTLANGTVKFAASGFYQLPNLVADGNCAVSNTPVCPAMGYNASATNSIGAVACGKWKSVRKTGEGDLLVASATGGDSLVVEKGSVTIDCGLEHEGTNYAAIAGLVEGLSTDFTPGDAQNDFGNMTAFTNRVCLSPVLAYYNGAYGEKSPSGLSNYYTYSGYIWNRTGQNVNWTFALALSTVSRITIDSKSTFVGNGSSSEVGIKTFELTPGPHRIVIAMRSNSDARSSARYFTNANYTWPEKYFGVGIDRLGRGSTNQADYEKLIDPGDGSLLTWALPEDIPCVYPGTENTVESLVPAQFGSMSFARGTSLRFNDVSGYSVSSVTGMPAVAGCGKFSISKRWTVDAADIAEGGKMTVDGELSFGDGSEMRIVGSSLALRKVEAGVPITIARAEGGISGAPVVATGDLEENSLDRWIATVSGNQITVVRKPFGMKIVVK